MSTIGYGGSYYRKGVGQMIKHDYKGGEYVNSKEHSGLVNRSHLDHQKILPNLIYASISRFFILAVLESYFPT